MENEAIAREIFSYGSRYCTIAWVWADALARHTNWTMLGRPRLARVEGPSEALPAARAQGSGA